ncbi:hypothetical protein ACGFX2_31960 [Streptomyces goshikiensis]|uniref:hypothetical protein n=1 Tax=Streptomyces goshikiensis TaxID=1942 RepID=UPI0037177876
MPGTEVVDGGIQGLCGVGRGSDEGVIADLQESREDTREEIQQLRELGDILRGLAIAPAAAPPRSSQAHGRPVQSRLARTAMRT